MLLKICNNISYSIKMFNIYVIKVHNNQMFHNQMPWFYAECLDLQYFICVLVFKWDLAQLQG